MEELLQSVDWSTVIETLATLIWTGIFIPVGRQVVEVLKARKLDKYATIFYEEIVKAVKSVYEKEVKDIKGSVDWTDEKKEEVREIAKSKAIQALSSIAYRTLREANMDFEEYLDSLIDTALYDVKNGLK